MDDDLIEGQFDLIDDRLKYMNDRLDILEGDREVRKARALEWLVIGLVALEAVFEVLMYVRGH
ncbi:hypothetical protein [Trinickia sp.]|uniref:hypothetical protein n=1 Tax=Trinickia sp. TaxID=2571163 RepID=UPI003F7E23A2